MSVTIILQEDEYLQAAELYERLNIPKSTWDKKRKKILEHLKLFCDFEILGAGRYTMYHIIEQFSDYEPYVGRNSKETNKKVYSNAIAKVVQEHPIATYRAINDDVIKTEEVKQLNHAESTSYGYVREVTKEDYGTKVGEEGKRGRCKNKVWAKKYDGVHWTALNETELKNWLNFLKESFNGSEEKKGEIISDYKNGIINKKIMKEKIGELDFNNYERAEMMFEERYGVTPRKVNEYELKAWQD